MANIIDAFQPEKGINLDDLVGIFAGTTDPSIVGETAPVGSLFIRSNGSLYQKVGEQDTDWNWFSQGLGETTKITANDTTAGFLGVKLQVSAALTKTVGNLNANETLILDLANVGSAGTYRQVTTNAKGQVISGANPTTLSGYGIIDAQPLDATLSALAAFNAVGILVQTTPDTFAARTILGTPDQITVSNGSGVGGNPTLSFPSLDLTFPGTAGVILPSGTSAERVATSAYLRFNSDTSTLEYYDGSTWVSLVASTGGTVTSVDVTPPAAGLTVAGAPITTSGTLTLALANDLAALEGLTGTGFAARTATDTWSTHTLTGTANRITITNGDGIAGAPTFDISSTYIGQPSIITLGNITTGSWAATPIDIGHGGTGRTTMGGANTILGVNTTNTGLEYKVMLAGTGITISPTAQQLLISNTGVTSITGTANQVITSATTGSITLSLPQSVGITSSPTFASVTLAADPTLPMQAATKQYVDTAVQGLDHKASAVAGTTGPITLSGEQTIDDVAVVAGDRVLVKNQTNPAENGIYEVSAGAWTRTLDLDQWTEVADAFVFIEEGTLLADTGWVSTAARTGTIGTTAMPWVQFSAAGIIEAGARLTKVGNVISLSTVGAPGSYNTVTTNAYGQVVAGSTQAFLTGNQNITLQGDITGVGSTLITTALSPTGISAGAYTKVTVDTAGRVVSGTTPTTLAGYSITDAQPLDAFLTALADAADNGFTVRSGDTVLLRTIEATSSKVVVVNGDGIAGNPAIDVVEANLTLNNISGTLSILKGGTNLTSLGAINQLMGVNGAGTGLEYKTLTVGGGLTLANGTNSIHIDTVNNGTVTSIEITGSTGLTVTGSPITDSGTISLTLGTELQGLSGLSTTGFISRTGAGTYVQRSIVSGAATITVTNPLGQVGNVALDLANLGTSGTYTKVTTDNFGRVYAGSNPTTLAGYGITDAQPLNTYLTNLAGMPGAGIIVKSGNTSFARTIVATTPKIVVQYGDGVAANPSIDVGIINLSTDLADVIVTAPVAGEALLYNGSTWVNGSASQKLYSEKPVAQVTPVAAGDNSIAMGSEATANAHDAIAIGRQSLARLPGIVQANGRFATQGDAQHGTYILRTSTINGTPGIELFCNGVNGGERLTLTSDTTWVWEATIVGHRTDDVDRAGFKLKGVVYCGGSLNSIAMLGTVSKEILSRTDETWDVNATVDTTQGSLKLTVKGASGKTIRWTAVVTTVEVTN